MDTAEIDELAKAFVTALEVAGERLPLERVIEDHLATFQTLRSLRLTWRGIASIMKRAGARRDDGTDIPADQFRASVSRLSRRLAPGTLPAKPRPSVVPQSAANSPRASRPPRRTPQERKSASVPNPVAATKSKSVSADEIAAALARIKK